MVPDAMSAPAERPAAPLTEDEIAALAKKWETPPQYDTYDGNEDWMADYGRLADEASEDATALIAEVRRLAQALGEYADRARWEFVAFPLANGNVRLCATFDGGWGVAEAALGTAPPAPQT